MNKESWLTPISKRDVEEFAHKHMGIKVITEIEEVEDESYGKFFTVRGLTQTVTDNGWKNSTILMCEFALGEYGPLDVDPHLESTVDDIAKLFSADKGLINLYLTWASYVSSKNEGRTINGKTYPECFATICNAQIDLQKNARIRNIEQEAKLQKHCVDDFTKQLEQSSLTEESQHTKK